MSIAATPTAPVLSTRDWGLLLILSVLWGGTFFFAAIALAVLPPLTLVLARVTIGALALLAWLRLAGIALPASFRVWLAFFGMGLLNNLLPFSLNFWGQAAMPHEIAASLASILNATTPVFAVISAHVLTRDEKLNPSKAVGVLLGFAGVALMIAPRLGDAGGIGAAGHAVTGMLACLGGAVIYGFAGLFGRRFKAMGVMPQQTAFGQLAASSVMMAPIALATDRPWTLAMPEPQVWAAVLALAVLSTAFAYVLYFRILATAGATNLMLVTFLIPVSAILLGRVFLGEHLQAVHVGGMALIGLGLAAIDGRLARLLFNR